MRPAKGPLTLLSALTLGLGFGLSAAQAQSPSQPTVSTTPAAVVPVSPWTGYTPGTAWTTYTVAPPRVVYTTRPRRARVLTGYREFGSGRPIALAKPWLPGSP